MSASPLHSLSASAIQHCTIQAHVHALLEQRCEAAILSFGHLPLRVRLQYNTIQYHTTIYTTEMNIASSLLFALTQKPLKRYELS